MTERKGTFYNPNATQEGLEELLNETQNGKLLRLLRTQHANDTNPAFPNGDYSQADLREVLHSQEDSGSE